MGLQARTHSLAGPCPEDYSIQSMSLAGILAQDNDYSALTPIQSRYHVLPDTPNAKTHGYRLR